MFQADEQYKDLSHLNTLYGKNLISPLVYELPKFEPQIKIGVLASGNGSNFEYLIKAIKDKSLNAKISVLIVNNPNCLAIQKARKYNIPCILINHKDCISRFEHDKLVMDKLADYSVELVVMAGWMRIVGENIINKYKNRLINIHPSLLPSFKGIDAINQAIEKKVAISGCTVHYVQKEVDSGSIIIQAAVPVQKEDSNDSLKKRIQDMEHIILPIAVALVAKKIREEFKDKK